jgi:predicted nucleotidyltransferase
MATIAQEQFNAFLRDIEPSASTKANAKTAHTNLRNFLREDEDFKEYHVETFLSGSYRRDTAIRPRVKNGNTERPDVDVIVVTNHTLSDDPAEVLDLLFRTLKNKYRDIRLQARSVGIETSNADMDVVPIVAPYGISGTVYIPDRKLEDWLETNPPGHTQWTTEVNKFSNGYFKPLVKLMKWWRRENPTVNKRPKGFVIEVITANCAHLAENQYADLFLGTLEGIVGKYAWAIELGIVPPVPDPSVPGNSVTDGMTFSAFKSFYTKAKAHGELGREAQAEDDEEKALEKWRKIFGNRSPSRATSELEGLLSAAAAPSSLTFPDRPIRPRRPGKFG